MGEEWKEGGKGEERKGRRASYTLDCQKVDVAIAAFFRSRCQLGPLCHRFNLRHPFKCHEYTFRAPCRLGVQPKTPRVFHVSVDETRPVTHFSKLLETNIMQASSGRGEYKRYIYIYFGKVEKKERKRVIKDEEEGRWTRISRMSRLLLLNIEFRYSSSLVVIDCDRIINLMTFFLPSYVA